MSRENPGFGEVIVNDVEDWHDLPDSNMPYNVLAKEGLFLHRRTAQGRGLIRWYKTPTSLKPTGITGQGSFTFDGAVVPAKIYAQAVDFFRRIWNKNKTEAAVIIVQHKTTGEYRLFIPTQDVSHGAVRSIYNTAHVHKDFLIVGTFHSHCNFGPSHSDTDRGDARDMDGLHGTIGYVDRDTPEMALMYALNGTLLDFRPPFDGVVDMSDLTAGTAPEWWDRYVLTEHVTDADRQRIAPYADNDQWDRFMGRRKKPEPQKSNVVQHPNGFRAMPPAQTTKQVNERGLSKKERKALRSWLRENPDSEWANELLSESQEFNRRQAELHKVYGIRSIQDLTSDPDEEGLDGVPDIVEDYWEDALGAEFVDSLFDTGLFTDEDLEGAINHWPRSGDPSYWEGRMKGKLFAAKRWLESQGLTLIVTIQDRRVVHIPGQTTLEEHIGGQIQ